ncbi:hypothetical protein MTO96_024180 [Rhipicephalus appendiculatus]
MGHRRGKPRTEDSAERGTGRWGDRAQQPTEGPQESQKELIDTTPGGNRFQATPPTETPDEDNHQAEMRIGRSQSRPRSAGESRHHGRQDHRLKSMGGHDLPQQDAKHHRYYYAAQN